MTSEEKAYIAGIIDGEGSIMLLRFHKNQLPAPCISIASTTLELLQYIKEKVNMGTIKTKKNYDVEHHKDSFTYVVHHNNAIKFLELIYPYIVIKSKKKRAELIINDYKRLTPRNGRYSEELLKLKQNFYNEFISIK